MVSKKRQIDPTIIRLVVGKAFSSGTEKILLKYWEQTVGHQKRIGWSLSENVNNHHTTDTDVFTEKSFVYMSQPPVTPGLRMHLKFFFKGKPEDRMFSVTYNISIQHGHTQVPHEEGEVLYGGKDLYEAYHGTLFTKPEKPALPML
jgi:hypothetical protein